ncbi:MAG: glycosyltransferase family 4 protein [Pseudomonadota bacterium]|nr:glycosyltransferase family 4 protein [Pseudomonadota bacterium]
MKRILFVNKYADNSGAPRHIFRLLQTASKQYDVSLCIGIDSPEMPNLAAAGIAVRRLSVLGDDATPGQIVGSIRALRQLFRELRPDLVHVHSPLTGFTARVASASMGIPCVFTAHGWNFAPGLSWKRRVASWLLEWAAARLGQPIIAVSAYDGALAMRARIARPPQLTVIPNGIQYQPPLPARSGHSDPVIVMVARFSDQKRQDDLIRATAAFPIPVRVRFIGDGERRSACEALAASLGLSEQVEFLGHLPSAEDELRKADIFVLSSNYEGLPLSILEAMRAGLPVVASSVGGVADAVADGSTGLLFQRGDVSALRQHLVALASNPSLRTRMGNAGRARFDDHFTEARMLQDTFEIYASLIASYNSKNRR